MTQYTSERLHIATYSNGSQGRGISKIDNYYFASTSNDIDDIPSTSDSRWKDSIDGLALQFNETNKYLWNFERITYTDKTSSDTNRTMLAVYSKDGKGIVGIYEYYKCTTTSASPSALPTVSDKNGWIQEGEKDGEGNTVSLPIPTAEEPYLWNYEIIDYTEGDDVTSGPVCIGTYGNSITEVKEWYQATNTNSAPTERDGGEADSKWVSTIGEAGHGQDTPYLWNYEETNYSTGDPKKTPVVLLAAEPRTIKRIIEYYRQEASTVTSVNGVSWQSDNQNHNAFPSIPTEWKTTYSVLQQGNNLWNIEVIEFTASDVEGKNRYTATEPAIVGYAGTDGVGTQGDSLQVQYQYAETISDLTDGNWSDTEPTRPTTDGKWLLWMRQKMSNVSDWSSPIQISALNGDPGADGSDIDYIYRRSESAITEWENQGPYNGSWSHTTQQVLNNGWTHSPQGIDPTNKYEYMTFATKPAGTGTTFSAFSNQPVLWSKWGDKGQDGAGIEYKYCRASSKPDKYPGTDISWTDDPQGVDSTNRYEYVCQLKTTYNTTTGEWDPEETSTNISLWNEYKENGKYVYATFEPNEIRKGTTNSITINLIQRIGEGAPTNCTDTAYLYYTRDGGTETPAGQFSNGQYIFNITESINDKIQFSIYSSNGNDKKTIDKETILALADGETAYYLYHNATSDGSVPDAPNANYIYEGTESESEQNWYDTQQTYSMYQTYKVCSSSKYAETDWGPVRRISGELTTYDDLWNILEEESSDGQGDGIYSFTDNDGKHRIGINADLIKVGAIRGKQIIGDAVKNEFFLTTDPNGESVEGFFTNVDENPYNDGTTTLNNVAFKAGTQFAVTVDGTVFAKTGEIANWKIEENGIFKYTYKDNEISNSIGLYSGDDLKVGNSNEPVRITTGTTEQNIELYCSGFYDDRKKFVVDQPFSYSDLVSATSEQDIQVSKIEYWDSTKSKWVKLESYSNLRIDYYPEEEWDSSYEKYFNIAFTAEVENLPTSINQIKVTIKKKVFAFAVTQEGCLYVQKAHFSKWEIDNKSFRKITKTYQEPGKPETFFIYPAGDSGKYLVNGAERSDWVLTVGENFGISKSGDIYAPYIYTSDGDIHASHISGGDSGKWQNYTYESEDLIYETSGSDESGGYTITIDIDIEDNLSLRMRNCVCEITEGNTNMNTEFSFNDSTQQIWVTFYGGVNGQQFKFKLTCQLYIINEESTGAFQIEGGTVALKISNGIQTVSADLSCTGLETSYYKNEELQSQAHFGLLDDQGAVFTGIKLYYSDDTTYSKNNLLKFINDKGPIQFITNGKTINVEDLAFKGPYDIIMGSTVIGYAWSIGPVVYGWTNTEIDFTSTKKTTLSVSSDLPKPYTAISFLASFKSGKKTVKINVSKNGVWEIPANAWNTTTDTEGASGYFCYSANKAYDIEEET